TLLSGMATGSFERVSIDSRTLNPGDVLFAIKGPRFDGHQFLRAAADRGASAVILEKFDGRATFHPLHHPTLIQVRNGEKALQDLARFIRKKSIARIVGITGSNGKTTTKEMV